MGLQKMQQLRDNLKQGSRGKVIYFEDDKVTEVRLLPVQGEDQPFKVAFVHYPSNKVVPKTVFSPKEEEGFDILEEYCDSELNKGHKEEKEFIYLINLKPKPVFIAPAIIRGEESKGVQLLSLNDSQYESLLKAYNNSFRGVEVEDLWDIDAGYDIIVDVKSGEPYRSIDFTIARNSSPLKSKGVDDETVVDWLENQPSWKEAYKSVTNEELERYLKNSLQDTDADEDDDDLAEYKSEKEYDVEDEISEEESSGVKDALEKFRKKSKQVKKNLEPELEENPF